MYNDKDMTLMPPVSAEETHLTIAMLETLFRGRNFAEAEGLTLPNGAFLSGSELRLLFEFYTV